MDIKTGQIWVGKDIKDPVCVTGINSEWINIEWIWQIQDRAWIERDSFTRVDFLKRFDFCAESMPYHEFKNWCANWEKGGDDDL